MAVVFRQKNVITEIGPGGLLHSLFSNIAYHLESSEWGSKYPYIMLNLYRGRLEESYANEAMSEVLEIRRLLSSINCDKLIWNIDDLREPAPWGDTVVADIGSISDFYVTTNGLNLVDEIVDNIESMVKLGGDLEIIAYGDGDASTVNRKHNNLLQRIKKSFAFLSR